MVRADMLKTRDKVSDSSVRESVNRERESEAEE
jgi:hypothetical protein